MNTTMITIPGEFSTMNQLRKSSEHLRQGTIEVYNYVKNRFAPIEYYPVQMAFDWYRADDDTDRDNVAVGKKGVLDGLVGAGILEDDGWSQISGMSDAFHIDAHNPRIVVSITPSGERAVGGHV